MKNQENKTNFKNENENKDLLFPTLVQNFNVIIRIVINDSVINDQEKMLIIQHANELINTITNSYLKKKNIQYERDVNHLIEYFFDQLKMIEAKYQNPLRTMNLIHSYL